MPRTRDLDAQQAELSAAVWSVLAERGPVGLTLRAVAEHAGCTTGLVLHAFRDKRSLLLHARDLLHERTRARMDAAEAAHDDPHDVLRAVVLDALPLDAERRANARVWLGFLAAALDDPELAARHARHNAAFRDRLAGLLERARPRVDPAARSTRVLALAAAVEGISVLASADPASWPDTAQRAAADVVLAAVTAAA